MFLKLTSHPVTQSMAIVIQPPPSHRQSGGWKLSLSPAAYHLLMLGGAPPPDFESLLQSFDPY